MKSVDRGVMSTSLLLGIVVGAAVRCHSVPGVGRVQGDVYLVMQNGDVKRAAANEVRAVRNPNTLRAGMDRVCKHYADRLFPVWRRARHRADSAQVLDLQMRGEMRVLLRGATVAHTSTNVNGRYHLDSLPPGTYALWAEIEIGDRHYTWWLPVTVAPGDTLTKDLDNSAEADAQLYCGWAVVEVLARLRAEDSLARVEDSLARVETQARRQSWTRCFKEAVRQTVEAAMVYACYKKLRTRADSMWADDQWVGRNR